MTRCTLNREEVVIYSGIRDSRLGGVKSRMTMTIDIHSPFSSVISAVTAPPPPCWPPQPPILRHVGIHISLSSIMLIFAAPPPRHLRRAQVEVDVLSPTQPLSPHPPQGTKERRSLSLALVVCCAACLHPSPVTTRIILMRILSPFVRSQLSTNRPNSPRRKSDLKVELSRREL